MKKLLDFEKWLLFNKMFGFFLIARLQKDLEFNKI